MVKHRKSFGFTLVELLIVIAVIGILAAVILVTINPIAQMQKARNAQRKSDLRTMANAVERYRAAYGSYPTTPVAPEDWCGAYGSYWYNCGENFIPNVIASGDLKSLPRDPLTGKINNIWQNCLNLTETTTYLYKSDGNDYKLLAHCTPEGNVLNNPSDPFYDPQRPTWAWQISSSDISREQW